jgi:hypothetical protein
MTVTIVCVVTLDALAVNVPDVDPLATVIVAGT